jgi:exonuclease I
MVHVSMHFPTTRNNETPALPRKWYSEKQNIIMATISLEMGCKG